MPIIDATDEATAQEIWNRSGLTPAQITTDRNLQQDEAFPIRQINRYILPPQIALVELQASGAAGAVGFPFDAATMAEATVKWADAQRTEHAANLLAALREWTVWLGVAAVRNGELDSTRAAQANQEKIDRAVTEANAVRDAVLPEIRRLAGLTAAGRAGAQAEQQAELVGRSGTVCAAREDGYSQWPVGYPFAYRRGRTGEYC